MSASKYCCCSFITNLVGDKESGRGKEGTDIGRVVKESLSEGVMFKLRAEGWEWCRCVKNLEEQHSRQRKQEVQRFWNRKWLHMFKVIDILGWVWRVRQGLDPAACLEPSQGMNPGSKGNLLWEACLAAASFLPHFSLPWTLLLFPSVRLLVLLFFTVTTTLSYRWWNFRSLYNSLEPNTVSVFASKYETL